jgi:hypothetical protein
VNLNRWVCSHQGLISRGYSYTLQKNNGESWELTDSTGKKLAAPAVCFIIPPTDPEALALADRYRHRGGRREWTHAWAPQPLLFKPS